MARGPGINGNAMIETTTKDLMEVISVDHEREDRLSVIHLCHLENASVFELVDRRNGLFRLALDPACGLKVGRDKFVRHFLVGRDPKNSNDLEA